MDHAQRYRVLTGDICSPNIILEPGSLGMRCLFLPRRELSSVRKGPPKTKEFSDAWSAFTQAGLNFAKELGVCWNSYKKTGHPASTEKAGFMLGFHNSIRPSGTQACSGIHLHQKIATDWRWMASIPGIACWVLLLFNNKVSYIPGSP